MSKGNVRKVFPGGNTPYGFYSFFRYIFPSDVEQVFVLKGGPGVGKSTLMQVIADKLAEAGFAVEEHHCSSDPHSLDGVYVPALKVGLVDGTAPHVVDPVYPGAVEKLVALGDYWDSQGLKRHRSEIVKLTDEIKRLFEGGYRHLAAARLYNEHIGSTYQDSGCIDFAAMNEVRERIMTDIFDGLKGPNPVARERHLFASAISPAGLYNFFPTLFSPLKKRYIIHGEPGTGMSTLASQVAGTALNRGFHVEVFHCPLDPERTDHVIIPELSIAIINGSDPHSYEVVAGDSVIDTGVFVKGEHLRPYTSELADTKSLYEDALKRAIRFLQAAKQAHDQLERYYVSNMDFTLVNKKREEILQQIWDIAEVKR